MHAALFNSASFFFPCHSVLCAKFSSFFLMPLNVNSIKVTETFRLIVDALKICVAASNSWVTWTNDQKKVIAELYPPNPSQSWFTAHKPQSWTWGNTGCWFSSMKTNGKSCVCLFQRAINSSFFRASCLIGSQPLFLLGRILSRLNIFYNQDRPSL